MTPPAPPDVAEIRALLAALMRKPLETPVAIADEPLGDDGAGWVLPDESEAVLEAMESFSGTVPDPLPEPEIVADEPTPRPKPAPPRFAGGWLVADYLPRVRWRRPAPSQPAPTPPPLPTPTATPSGQRVQDVLTSFLWD